MTAQCQRLIDRMNAGAAVARVQLETAIRVALLPHLARELCDLVTHYAYRATLPVEEVNILFKERHYPVPFEFCRISRTCRQMALYMIRPNQTTFGRFYFEFDCGSSPEEDAVINSSGISWSTEVDSDAPECAMFNQNVRVAEFASSA